jgi:hypothetical protein
MSEFKFSCPNCQQNIQATSEYCGVQINCPSCQTPIVVPADPSAPTPPPQHGARLAQAASTPHQPSGAGVAAAFYSKQQLHKKESKTGKIVGWSVGACVVAAAIIFGPNLWKKYAPANMQVAAPAPQVETNAEPPPPPPELTTEEILQNVGDAYKGLTDYAAKAQTVCDLDMSALAPNRGRMNATTTSALQLGRTNYYRLEWEQSISGNTVKGAAWSSGKGNFVGYATIPPSKVKNRLAALAPSVSFFLMSSVISELFFSETNSLVTEAKRFTKTNGPSLSGQACYVLAGEANHLSLLIWVDKKSFLISQVEVIFGQTIDEAELKKIPSAQRSTVLAMSKLKGTVIETYDSIQTNKNLQASAFESSYQPTVNPAAAAPRPRRASSMAGQLADPATRRRQQP